MKEMKRLNHVYFVILTIIGLMLGELTYTASSQTGLLLAAPNCPGGNHIVCENSLSGNPSSEWDISGVGDTSIQGFATEISVNLGETVRFKIDTPSSNYRLDIYRMGYYGGDGARKVATVEPTATLPQDQPLCLTDSTGLIDCGNWTESASWSVPTDATSGIFFAKAIREDGSNTGASHIVFVVRDDASSSDLLFQTSDTTWQAYNDYGGNNLYGGNGPGTGLSGGGRAYKVSYNRPFFTRNVEGGEDWVFNAEYPMVRWLEANGYDMSYITGVDSDRRGNLINNHNVFLSVAHDEYWSGDQRTNVETARDAGIHLAFFSGNEVFWKIRWENSIDASGTAYRTLVCYKETHEGAKIDPTNIWTGTWRDPRFSPPADGGRPENELTGVIFGVNGGSPASTGSIKVPEADGKMRFWRNTSVATLAQGTEATLPFGTLGYEWDEVFDNGFRPFGLISLSSTTVENAPVLVDFGSTFESATATHSLTLYRDSTAGSIVFGAGTIQWSWGLDSNHDRGSAPSSPDMQQATVNLFADMGVQPDTLQSGLQAATQSTDSTAPISTISVPGNGSTVTLASSITINGTATDTGGLVGGIEVSVDGGLTWGAATGRNTWSYNWTAPNSPANVTIMSRATDDSLNIESPGAVSNVLVTSGTDTTPPTVIAQSPLDGSTVIGLNAIVTSTFSEAMLAASINSSTFQLQNGSTLVAVTVSYTDNTATLTPNAPLTENTIYTVTVKGGAGGVEDLSGNLLASDVTWQFTTGTVGSPNCGTGISTIWPATITPTVPADPDTAAIELGVKFTADTDGFICGIRFFKGITNTGTHVGNLWNISGTLLATATFTNETNSGWQQVSFANPVAITANTSYVASYHAPVGQYSIDADYFNGFQQDNPPLHALEDVASGGNGVFLTGLGGFPVNTFGSSNYWVDVVYTANTIGDVVPPVVTSVSPTDNSTGISPAIEVTAVFNEAVDPATVDATTFELRDQYNTLVGATVSYAGVTATLVPNAVLVPNTIYTATVKSGANGVRDLAGNQLASDQSWQFTTATLGSAECIIGTSTIWSETAIPAVTSDPDTSAIELGVKFSSETDGFICGIRFFKGTANTGTHIGNLWSLDGTLLATATFTNETGSGWQQVSFASPVAITANTTYVASYHAPVGRYSVNEGYFSDFEQVNLPLKALEDVVSERNGVFLPGTGGFPNNTFMSSNYWVDVVFSANTVSDTTAPTMTSVTPVDNSTDIDTATNVNALFSEALDPVTVSSSTFELRDPDGNLVTAAVSLNGNKATLTPTAALLANTTYTATVKSGITGVKDLAGNPLASDVTWKFTTTDGVTVFVQAGFDTSTDGFTYVDDEFRNTAEPAYASGSRLDAGGFTGGGLQVFIGGLDNNNIFNMSGAWQQNFVLDEPTEITVTTRYNLTQAANYESDEFSQVLLSIDGILEGTNSSDFIAQIVGDGNGGAAQTTGWQLFVKNIGVLPAGQHSIAIGGFNNKKTWDDESTSILIDDVQVSGELEVIPPDTTLPTITTVSPLDNSNGNQPGTDIVAVFSELLDPLTVNSTTFELQDSDGVSVVATISYTGNTATLTPTAPLAINTTYTATVKGGVTGVKDLAGNPLASDVTWQFTTTDGVTVFVQSGFDTSTDGFTYVDDEFRNTTEPAYVSGSRLDTGGFTGGGLQVFIGGLDNNNIFNMSGAWQQNFVLDEPTEITVTMRYNLTQAANYESDEFSQVLLSIDGILEGTNSSDFIAQIVGDGNGGAAQTTGWQLFVKNIGVLPAGQHSIAIGGFNNKKTWDDESTSILIDDVQVSGQLEVIPPDTTLPTITTVSPLDNSIGNQPGTDVVAVFSELLDPLTVNSTTFELQDPDGVSVVATISYTGNTATLTPTAPLAINTTYTATVKGGVNGAKDLAGNPLASDITWQFTTSDGVTVFIQAGFDTNTDGFTYVDDGFRNTTEPAYVSGSRLDIGGFTGGGLQVFIGGLDTNNIFNMSGAWQQNFVLDEPTEITVTMRYNLTLAANYESDEFSQVLLSIDGVLEGAGSSDFISQIVGDGNGGAAQTTGWQLFVKNIGVLPAGQHSIAIGGFNNKKTWDDEATSILVDDVQVSGQVPL